MTIKNKKKNITNQYIFFIPINKKLISELTKNGIMDNQNIEAKIIKMDDKNIKIGFGIFAMNTPTYKDINTKIKWISDNSEYTPDIKYSHPINTILDFDIKLINKDFQIKKRTPIYPQINDDIILKINNKFIKDSLMPEYIAKIINILEEFKDDGLVCKILTYNLWDPPSSIEILNQNNESLGFKKNIPGSIILGSGKWNKYKIPKTLNSYELLPYNIFPIDNLDKKNINNNYIFSINNKDLFYFNFYILK